jgi:hypothetical protein
MSKPGTNHVDLAIRPDGVAVVRRLRLDSTVEVASLRYHVQVTLDHYPLNTLSNALMLGIEDAAEKIVKDPNVKGVVVQGAGIKAFCAGADVVDLNKKHARNPKKNFTQYFEALHVPVVAAIRGFAAPPHLRPHPHFSLGGSGRPDTTLQHAARPRRSAAITPRCRARCTLWIAV